MPVAHQYDKGHVYSTAPEATRKRALDVQIMGGDYRKGGDIHLDSEDYLKRLIELASGGKKKVGVVGSKVKARLQFLLRHAHTDPHRKNDFFTERETTRPLQTCRDHFPASYPFISLLVRTGMRLGEA